MERAICEKIVSGQWPPGSRLRTRAELHKEFEVSMVTLQQAFDRLAEDGFVQARGRNGTFVAEHPPYVSRFALAIPFHPEADRDRWSNLWYALVKEAEAMNAEQRYTIVPYYGVGLHPDSPDYRALVYEVEAHRIAGIIFATHPFRLSGTPLTEQPGVPHAAIMSAPSSPTLAAVDLDTSGFYQRALDYLASRGCKRIGIIAVRKLPVAESRVRGWMARRGQETRRQWIQMQLPWLHEGVRRCVHLLMSNGADRPDGLVVADDNLVPGATQGLVDAGVNVPGEAEVVAHSNFPWPTPSAVQVKRMGFDVRRLLRECMDRILEQRRGEEPAPRTTIEAVTEEELGMPEPAATHVSGAGVGPRGS